MRSLFLFSIFFLICVFAGAQPKNGTACLIIGQFAGNGYYRIYNSVGGYSQTNYSDWASNGGIRTTGDSFQYKCINWSGGYTNLNNCTAITSLGNKTGTLGVFSGSLINNCPLDDYIWLLIFPLGTFGFFYMRKRSLLSLT